jgi:hypothetical protein
MGQHYSPPAPWSFFAFFGSRPQQGEFEGAVAGAEADSIYTITSATGRRPANRGLFPFSEEYFSDMTGKKPPKATGRVRRAFAQNVRGLLDDRFSGSANKPKALSVLAGISLSSVQRAVSGETSPTLDTVEAIADALQIEPHKLIQPANHDTVKIGGPRGPGSN